MHVRRSVIIESMLRKLPGKRTRANKREIEKGLGNVTLLHIRQVGLPSLSVFLSFDAFADTFAGFIVEIMIPNSIVAEIGNLRKPVPHFDAD